MGGQYKVFPKKLRIVLVTQLIFQIFFVIVILQMGGFSVVVFKKSNQDNLHSYGFIPFVEYGHEFCVKE